MTKKEKEAAKAKLYELYQSLDKFERETEAMGEIRKTDDFETLICQIHNMMDTIAEVERIIDNMI